MNERSLKVLEFHKIKEQLVEKTETTIGAELARKLKPEKNIKKVQRLQDETDEAAQLIRLNYSLPLGGITDIRKNINHTKIGGLLKAQQCLAIANVIYAGRKIKKFMNNLEEDLPLLKRKAVKLSSLKHIQDEINRCIDEEAKVVDEASDTLRSIRTTIRTLERRIRERLQTTIQRKANLLSDSLVTIRNNRYVLPVKHEHRTSFGGIVHDQSASGQTLFMEPTEIVQMNNELQTARVKEKQEIERILQQLSEKIAAHAIDLLENVRLLAEIDFIHARAQLGYEMRAVKPTLNDQGIIRMKQARHPLIPDDEVVPNDIHLGESYTAILITGPNTGGKTVTLKMIGLCTLMAQAGLQIPALDGCEIAVFKDVFADIGDEQSIEQNLSTFSSHMSNIVDIIDRVDNQSLVLFDELGAGTDPQEGAALAMAILDEVVLRNARVVATTHYPELKAYAYNTEKVVNASVEFDIETLQPTYKLLIGIPGRSNAFEISRRLGLKEDIITRAKKQIGVDTQDVEQMIFSLEQSYKKADKAYEESVKIQTESEQLLQDLKDAWENFLKKREDLYQAAEEKASREVQRARMKAEQIVEEMKEMKEAVSFKEHKWIDAQKKLDEAEVTLVKETDQQVTDGELQPLQKDDPVLLKNINQRGVVLDKVSNDEYTVQVGVMRINVKREELKYLDEKETEDPTPRPMVKRSNTPVKLELDLRGERYEDAINKLDHYIDDALLANYDQVTIIHGKGTGALRKGVEQYCQKHPRIKEFRLGGEKEGGSGVTIIKLV